MNQEWFFSDTCQASIGQLYNSYTMLQMARAIGGIATNQLVTPHFIKEVVDQDGLVVVPERIERSPLYFRDETSPFFARRWSDYRTMSHAYRTPVQRLSLRGGL